MNRDPARALIVDDDPASLALLRLLLELEGCEVYEATDAAEALEVIAHHRVDVAFVDLVLPDRSGGDLADEIRALGFSDLPLVAVSAHFGPLDAARVSPSGFAECLAKPIDAAALRNVAQSLLLRADNGEPDLAGAGRSVLLVDDDPVQLRLHRAHLERLGFQVQTAADGAEALSLARTAPPDAIVADVLMPKLDGFELCLALRQEPATAATPIVLVSSHYVEDGDADLARRVGATQFVVRTPGINRVVPALIDALQGRAEPVAPRAEALGQLAVDHAARVARQLERQARLNSVLREREAFQRALLAVSAAVAEVPGHSRSAPDILRASLRPILDIPGMREVFGFLRDRRGELEPVCNSDASVSRADALSRDTPWVNKAVERGEVVVVPAAGGPAIELEWLEQADCQTLLLVPVGEPGSPPLGAIAMASEQTGVSSEVFAFARSLRHTVGQALVHAYAEERYLHAQKLDLIGRLAAGIAHDFNNLLAGIAGFASVTRAALEPGTQAHKDQEEILLAVDRGAALTRQLLAFGRRQSANPRVIAPDEVIKQLAPMLERMLPDEYKVIAALNAPSSRLFADPTQLEQILVNLTVNARDAMASGGRIEIRSSERPLEAGSSLLAAAQPAGRYYVFEVADQGTGMSPDVLERVFEPFFTTKEPGKGTGLGLATVHGIVTQAQGNVTVQTAEGEGTTVRIAMPLASELVEGPAPAAKRSAPRRTGTLLFVDDEAALRRVFPRALRRAGYRVLVAPDGEAALRLAAEEEGSIHLLITDVSMPGMNGLDLSRRLTERRPGMPTLFISGYADVALEGLGSEGRNRFLAKPFGARALLDTVAEIISDEDQ